LHDPQWLDQYGGETVEELIALGDTHRIDSLVLAFEQAMDQKVARVGYELACEERIILAVEALAREVNNGGMASSSPIHRANMQELS
jgi:hypothetical protein